MSARVLREGDAAAAPPSDRVRVRRKPDRGAYDRATIHAILDEGLIAHVGVVDDGQPFVIPTNFARDGESVILHGSSASRAMRLLASGAPACLTVTLIDGLVLARSANNHSTNYRSVVALGSATLIDDPDEKLAALRAVVERVVPGRWDEIRPPNPQEFKSTMVVRLPLDEASAKVRTGPPMDPPEDVALPAWAGVLPLRQAFGEPRPAPDLSPGIEQSEGIRRVVGG